MVGAKLAITGQDRKALRAFFTNLDFVDDDSPYLCLKERLQSTREIANQLQESQPRTKRRLEKLSGLDLLDVQTIDVKTRTDSYWFISHTGMYYMMTTLSRPEQIKYLASNEKKMREFIHIKKYLIAKRPEVAHFVNTLKKYSKAREYHQILPFAREWLKNVFGNNSYSLIPYTPSIKDIIRTNYKIKTIKELEKIYGKIPN